MNYGYSGYSRGWLQGGRNPATRTLILANLLAFLLTFFSQSDALIRFFGFSSADWLARPWSFATYPLVAVDFINLLFSALWLWFVGGSLERAWGTARFTSFFAVVTAVSAFFFLAAASVLGGATSLLGLYMPLAALTAAWCMLNPEQTILLYCIIPIKGKYLGWLTIALVYFLHGPKLGLFALGGISCAWLYVRYLRSGSFYDTGYRERGRIIRIRRNALPRESVSAWWNPFSWLRAWQDRQRLRKLFDTDPFKGKDDEPPALK